MLSCRLNRIMELMSVMEQYSPLETCRIEAVDSEGLWKVVQLIFNNLKKKPYDLLDHRKTDFDSDYSDFKQKIAEQHVRMSRNFPFLTE